MADDIKIHKVELLSISSARISDGTEADGQRVVVATIRPELPSYRPHNLAFSLEQGERLFHDLRAVLKRAGVQSLMALLVISTGCSGQVELTTENRTPSETSETVEKLHSSVGIDVLSSPEKTSVSPPEEPPVLPEGKVRSVEIDGDGNVVIVVEAHAPEQSQQEAAAKKPTSGWNSKIGWPTQLRGASSWKVGCYLAVWGLIIGSIAIMIDNLKRKEGGPLLSVIAMLGTAAVLLQFLPHTESGLQFVPASPWAYVGWESFLLSLFCWAAILGGIYVVVDRSPDSPQAFSVLCLVAVTLNLALSWSDLKEDLASRPQAAACLQVEAPVVAAWRTSTST